MEPLLEFGCGSRVEGLAVVQPAGDEGLGDPPSGFGGDPSVDFVKHTEGVEAGGGDGIDLLGH